MGQHVQSERAVIGSMLIDPGCIDLVKQYIPGEEYFQNKDLKELYRTIVKMHDNGSKVDLITVGDNLANPKQVTAVAEAMDEVVTSSHAEEYAKIVKDYYIRNVLSQKLRSIDPTDYSKYNLPLDALNELEKIVRLGETLIQEPGDVDVKEIVSEIMGEFLHEDGPTATKIIPTGYYDLDRMISGLETGENIVVAGRPGMGKTALSLNIAVNIAKQGHKVLFFSLEMSKRRLIDRLLCMEGRIDATRFKRRELHEEEYKKLVDAASVVSSLPMVIIDNVSTTTEIKSIVAQHATRGEIGLVVIDFLQLVKDPASRNKTRSNEVGDTAKTIQRIGHVYNVPVIIASQLNRECEKRDNKRPRITDLYESGDIEAAADKVLFIYRDEQYDPNTEDIGIAEIGVGKQRDGPKGMCRLAWLDFCTKFDNLATF